MLWYSGNLGNQLEPTNDSVCNDGVVSEAQPNLVDGVAHTGIGDAKNLADIHDVYKLPMRQQPENFTVAHAKGIVWNWLSVHLRMQVWMPVPEEAIVMAQTVPAPMYMFLAPLNLAFFNLAAVFSAVRIVPTNDRASICFAVFRIFRGHIAILPQIQHQ